MSNAATTVIRSKKIKVSASRGKVLLPEKESSSGFSVRPIVRVTKRPPAHVALRRTESSAL